MDVSLAMPVLRSQPKPWLRMVVAVVAGGLLADLIMIPIGAFVYFTEFSALLDAFGHGDKPSTGFSLGLLLVLIVVPLLWLVVWIKTTRRMLRSIAGWYIRGRSLFGASFWSAGVGALFSIPLLAGSFAASIQGRGTLAVAFALIAALCEWLLFFYLLGRWGHPVITDLSTYIPPAARPLAPSPLPYSAGVPTVAASSFCQYCGHTLGPQARFCANCGQAVG